jgi:hypothetical protein
MKLPTTLTFVLEKPTLTFVQEKTTMRKSFACLFLAAVSWLALGSLAFAAPTTTAAVASNAGFVLTPNTGTWTTVLQTTIKNPTADDDLFIDVSQVDALVTDNFTSSAIPGLVSVGAVLLQMRVQVDGITATPGAIDFDDQLTRLTSNLQRFQSLNCTTAPAPQTIVTTSCVCSNAIPVVVPQAVSCAPPPAPIPFPFLFRSCTSQTTIDTDVVTTCNLVPGANQSLATLLEESIGHSYDFYAKGVGGMGDTHIVQVQEKLFEGTFFGSAEAFIGPSTLKIQAVNLKP